MHADGPFPRTASHPLEDLSPWCPLEHSVSVAHVPDDATTTATQEELSLASTATQEELSLASTATQEELSLASTAWSSVDCGVAQFLPSVYYSMQCEALLQESPGSAMSVVVVVLVRQAECFGLPSSRVGSHRVGRRAHLATSTGNPYVGRTLTPRPVKAGHLRVRLVSKDFVADTVQGEHPSLCKSEKDFRGGDFEKQFACRYKLGPVKEGLFGKVVIEHVTHCGEVETVLEFNLTTGGDTLPVTAATLPIQNTPSTQVNGPAPDSAKRPVHEIAASLRITDGENWRSLARHFGFNSKEVSHFASTAAPFTNMISSYELHGGTVDEIIQAMYDVSHEFSFSRQKRKRSASPEVLKRLPVAPRHLISTQMTAVLGEESEDENEDGFPGSVFRSENLEVTPKGVLPLTSSPFTVTPPTTPRKRNSTSCSDTDLSFLVKSPAKRMCKSLFSFDDHEDLSRRMCIEKPTGSVLWNISEHMTHAWKHVGRTLNVPEAQLCNIESEHAHRCLRECAYEMLLKWRDFSPRKFTYGTLYSALCENGLTAHALRFCTL